MVGPLQRSVPADQPSCVIERPVCGSQIASLQFLDTTGAPPRFSGIPIAIIAATKRVIWPQSRALAAMRQVQIQFWRGALQFSSRNRSFDTGPLNPGLASGLASN